MILQQVSSVDISAFGWTNIRFHFHFRSERIAWISHWKLERAQGGNPINILCPFRSLAAIERNARHFGWETRTQRERRAKSLFITNEICELWISNATAQRVEAHALICMPEEMARPPWTETQIEHKLVGGRDSSPIIGEFRRREESIIPRSLFRQFSFRNFLLMTVIPAPISKTFLPARRSAFPRFVGKCYVEALRFSARSACFYSLSHSLFYFLCSIVIFSDFQSMWQILTVGPSVGTLTGIDYYIAVFGGASAAAAKLFVARNGFSIDDENS